MITPWSDIHYRVNPHLWSEKYDWLKLRTFSRYSSSKSNTYRPISLYRTMLAHVCWGNAGLSLYVKVSTYRAAWALRVPELSANIWSRQALLKGKFGMMQAPERVIDVAFVWSVQRFAVDMHDMYMIDIIMLRSSLVRIRWKKSANKMKVIQWSFYVGALKDGRHLLTRPSLLACEVGTFHRISRWTWISNLVRVSV